VSVTTPTRRIGRALPLIAALGLVLATAPPASASEPLRIVSQDPYVNPDSYHRTEVEPDTYAFGSTIVSTFQVGRYFDGGASNNGWATSTDGGASWTRGFLPGTTGFSDPPGPWDRFTDPAVAYDALHDVWMINSLAMDDDFGAEGDAIVVNRSTDGGLTFDEPVIVDDTGGGEFFDKNWITCDNWPDSPFYGRCYTQWDDFGQGNQLEMEYSSNGGLTWTTSVTPGSSVIGGVPVAQPNGTVVVPIDNGFASQVQSFTSTNGGVSYTGPFLISSISDHDPAGNLRSIPLPSSDVDEAGEVYVVWQDCRFRAGCSANDIVMSTSTNGTTWSAPLRIPIDPTNSGIDHVIPGIAVEVGTSGASAHLGLTYYYYENTSCTESNCRIHVGFISSSNGGASWSAPTDVAGPFKLTWFPFTSQGYMVGDYISTSFAPNGLAYPVVAIGRRGTCDLGNVTSCRVPMAAPRDGLAPLSGGGVTPAGLDRPIPGHHSDHPANVLLSSN
jgi:hypothetical protein